MREIYPILIFLLTFVGISSCHFSAEPPSQNRPVLSTTVRPVAFFMEKIAGEDFQINVMVPDGMAPVAYEPNAQELVALENSTLYFSLHALSFERTMLPKIAKDHPQMELVNLTEGIEMIREEEAHDHHHGVDPHVWMSPKQAYTLAKNIHTALVKKFPEKEAMLTQNFQQLNREIEAMDHYLTQSLQKQLQRSFMIYHPALSYLARDYGLEQISIEIEGKEPSPNYLQKVIRLAKEKNMDKLFIQRQFDRNFAHIVAKETGARVIIFDPLSGDWKKAIQLVTDELRQ
ncbi:MAG: zinc ABC transporter substrate-binding protein [Bacteroidetes bacterium]|nr:MAG: zinc ABC transporter substrate-binding protein [Bacteroidota bacterium]